MKKIVHVIVAAMLHALWIAPLWIIVTIFTMCACAFADTPSWRVNRIVGIEGLAFALVWIIIVAYKATE